MFDRLCESESVGLVTPGLVDLLAGGESQTVEFKSTARVNLHTGARDKRMEHVISKSVCGFLNAEGGKLLIGVDDQGTLLGLDTDMRTLGKKGNRDGFELALRQSLDHSLSALTASTVRIEFESCEGADVCVVTVAASGKPVFARSLEGAGEPSEFWVRMGNATKQIHGADMLEYQSEHWG